MPTSENILKLLKYIVCYATEHNIYLTTVRLVKFVYLADLYHARLKSGETITGFPWAFINYGPYCREVMQAIDDAALKGFINRKVMESKYNDQNYNLFSCSDDEYSSIKKDFPLLVIFETQHAIRTYGDDTGQLLDYVYFDTEPMREVRKGDLLDFKKAKMPDPIKTIETRDISKKNIDTIKQMVRKLREKQASAQDRLHQDDMETSKWKDDIYFKTLDCLDDEPLEIGLKGTARIDIRWES